MDPGVSTPGSVTPPAKAQHRGTHAACLRPQTPRVGQGASGTSETGKEDSLSPVKGGPCHTVPLKEEAGPGVSWRRVSTLGIWAFLIME